MEHDMPKWEYLELKITHGEVEIVDDEFRTASGSRHKDPYEYVKHMIEDGWQLVTRSGTLSGEFSVVLKRPIRE
jgi:hypothetical protein